MSHERPIPRFAREVDMYQSLLCLFQVGVSFAEVPFFGKRIDLVFATPAFRRLYAVETKLHDWRSAFKQAALNQLAAQHSFIALPERLALRLIDREKDLFSKYDVGLIAVSHHARIVMPPKKNGCFSLRHHHVLKNALKRVRSKKPKTIGATADAIAKRSQPMVVLQTWAD